MVEESVFPANTIFVNRNTLTENTMTACRIISLRIRISDRSLHRDSNESLGSTYSMELRGQLSRYYFLRITVSLRRNGTLNKSMLDSPMTKRNVVNRMERYNKIYKIVSGVNCSSGNFWVV